MTFIKKNVVVFFRYIMKNNREEVIEDIMQGPSKSYLHGSSNILLSLQNQLEGLQVGDRKTVYLKTDTNTSDAYSFDIVIDQLRPALEEEILLGYPVAVTDAICDAHCNC